MMKRRCAPSAGGLAIENARVIAGLGDRQIDVLSGPEFQRLVDLDLPRDECRGSAALIVATRPAYSFTGIDRLNRSSS